MTSLNLRIGTRELRVVVDSRRAAKVLRRSLDEHIVTDHDSPLAFILTAPTGFQRNHGLTDRAGITLSEGRGLNAGLHALANHLAAIVEPSACAVRIAARALVGEHGAVLCLEPLLHFPAPDRGALADIGYRLVDRLAVDLDIKTGHLISSPIPWPDLERIGNRDDEHGPLSITAVLVPGAPEVPPSRAEAASELATRITFGLPREGLATIASVMRDTTLLVASPNDVLKVLANFHGG